MSEEKCKYCGSDNLFHLINDIEEKENNKKGFITTKRSFVCRNCGKVSVFEED